MHICSLSPNLLSQCFPCRPVGVGYSRADILVSDLGLFGGQLEAKSKDSSQLS